MKKLFKFLFLSLILFTGCKENNTNNEKVIKEDVFNWIKGNYENKIIYKDISLPIEYPNSDVEIEFFSFSEIYLDNSGKFNAPKIDCGTEILFTVLIDGQKYELFVPVIFKGYENAFDEINEKIEELIPEKVESNINLPTYFDKYNCEVEWKSLNDDLITTSGIINKDPDKEKDALLEYKIKYCDNVKEYVKAVTIVKMTDYEKIDMTNEWLEEKMSTIKVIDTDIVLDYKYKNYNTYIIWSSSNPTVLTSRGKYTEPFNDENVVLEARISSGTKSKKYRYNLIAKGENNIDIWKKIESFLNKINIKEIENQKFYLYGSEAGYEEVLTQNLGYIPFLDNTELKINVDILPSTSPLKPNKERDKTKYIVIHNTGMAHPSATAKGLNEYIHTTDRIASWHFSVDDNEAYQELDFDEVGWHAGDSSYISEWSDGIGGGNLYGVAIESCVYEGVDFNKVLMNVAKLSANLMIKYDLDMQSIKQHYDFNGKDCPQVIRHASRWNELLNLIRLEYFLQTELNEVSFKWTSLTPDIMDDTGKIINHPGCEAKVKYQVEVTYNNETRIFEFESTLDELK